MRGGFRREQEVLSLYVRIQAAVQNRRGSYPGVFALINRLVNEGRLTADQEAAKQAGYAWFGANLIEPSTVNPSVFDRELNPGARAWFKASAREHIERATEFVEMLATHGVECEVICTRSLGVVVYEDEHQVIALPERTGDAPAPNSPMAVK